MENKESIFIFVLVVTLSVCIFLILPAIISRFHLCRHNWLEVEGGSEITEKGYLIYEHGRICSKCYEVDVYRKGKYIKEGSLVRCEACEGKKKSTKRNGLKVLIVNCTECEGTGVIKIKSYSLLPWNKDK